MTRENPSATSELDRIADTAAELAELRSTADHILQQAWTVEQTRTLLDDPDGAFDVSAWNLVAQLGWPAVLVSEDNGGGGGKLRQLCVLAEAAGSVALPVPLASAAAANWCVDRCAPQMALLLEDVGATCSGSTVTGTWPAVGYGAVADTVVVSAWRDDEPVLGTVDLNGPGVKREPERPLDRNPAASIALESAQFDELRSGTGATDRHRDAVAIARLATVSELIGIASAANLAAAEYAKARSTFGRPIGTRQAIKHRLVDQLSVIEVARALVHRAADAHEQQHPDAAAQVSLAAFWAIDTLRKVPEGATQVFGGIGYTWEHQAHVHLRRAATCAASLGSRSYHRGVAAGWLSSR
ncbi:acyl-CoA dehydrogenase family protein [Mycolicibacterium sp. 050232]|uniref:acyl-CoA dehydrogenase family protein n=1 Tax=Mycolicibacterium sp. 050232 TaxID=3113982 RepID=UPI002E29A929|nr:acyl-CoA dehydrogenase family protein [Mycolicibacterium sp. 050232]MED5810843.1 acyl-CoA dehydrogenase family protein [Mycolicibacterium sp. 050232]